MSRVRPASRTSRASARLASPPPRRARPPARARRRPAAERRRGDAASAAGTTATGSGSSTASHASARTSSRAAGQRRSCAETVASGTLASRDALRRRHSAAGVSNTTATAGTWLAAASWRHRARIAGSRPSVSTAVVRRRRIRRATMSSSTAKASVDAARSCGESPTTARRSSLDTICSGANVWRAQVLLPDATGPTSTTRHGAGSVFTRAWPGSAPTDRATTRRTPGAADTSPRR